MAAIYGINEMFFYVYRLDLGAGLGLGGFWLGRPGLAAPNTLRLLIYNSFRKL
jgi:hypothetical protein